jgi:transcription elongation factor Elf1
VSEDYFECRRCGMHLLYRSPLVRPRRGQERLVCSECGIVFGVLVPNSRRNKRVICWLIRKSYLGEGVRKIA